LFQSAPPVKGAIWERTHFDKMFEVSIRAPREGGDGRPGESLRRSQRFNPRPP